MKTSKILKAINNFSELDLIELNNIYCDSINAKESIKNDNRFCERIKTELLNYIETFKITNN